MDPEPDQPKACRYCKGEDFTSLIVPSVYDSTLVWICDACDAAQSRRFIDKGLALASQNTAREWNSKRGGKRA